MNHRSILLLVSLAAVAAGGVGCKSKKPAANEPGGNFYLAQGVDISMLGRVVLVELENLSSHPEISRDISATLYEELQKKNLFGLDKISREDPLTQGLLAQPDRTFSYEELDLLRKSLKTDALLVGSVTQYYPYPRLTIGLRLKLIDLRDGSLVWAIEQLWDSTDKKIEKRIEEYFKQQVRSGYEPLNYRMIMVSPRMFLKFVAFEAVDTLKSKNRGKLF